MNLLQLAADVTPATFQLPPGASAQAAGVDWVFYFIYWLCVISFVGVCIAMAVFARVFRRQPGIQADQEHNHNLALELGWTLPPTIIVVFLFWWGFEGYVQLRTPPADAYKIEVTAEKWKWTFKYPNGAEVSTNSGQTEEMMDKSRSEGTKPFFSPDMGLHVWKGQPFVLVMTSKDVLHAFYVPDFRVKQDVVPGRYTKLWFTPLKSSSDPVDIHRVFCAEYCGDDHSQMWSQVVVHETKEDFDAWLKNAKRTVWDLAGDPKAPDYLVKVGKLFYQQICSTCHSDKPGERKTGPSFADLAKKFGQQRPIQGGSVDLSTDDKFLAYVTESVKDPNAQLADGFQPGMTQGLSDVINADAPEPGMGYRAMAAFIRSLAKE